LKRGDDEDEPSTYWAPRSDRYKNQLLDEIFTSRNLRRADAPESTGRLSVNSFYEYAQDIKEAVRKYYEIYNPEHASLTDPEKVYLERLRRLGDAEDMMLVLAIYRTDANASSRVLVLMLLEKILFLDMITPYIAGVEKPKIAHLAARITAGTATLAEVEADLSEFYKSVMKKADFPKVIQQWSKGGGGYRWRGVRYFLYEYEQKLKAASKTHRDKLIWDEFIREKYEDDFNTVEHIFPQKTSAEPWREVFARFSTKEKNILKNSLGNLVPLSRAKNSALGALGFAAKKRNPDFPDNTVGYIYGCYSENEVAECEEWTAREILLRGVRLLRFMEERWEVPLGDDSKKVTALGLGFVYREYPELKADIQPQE
jgi:hypothetical protein